MPPATPSEPTPSATVDPVVVAWGVLAGAALWVFGYTAYKAQRAAEAQAAAAAAAAASASPEPPVQADR